MLENISSKTAVILAALAAVAVGYATDSEVLALLNPTAAMLLKKAVIYGGGAGFFYKMTPKQDEPKP